jgi:hypothetical protein
MKALDPKSVGTLARRLVHILAASSGMWACSDPLSTSPRRVGARQEVAVTLPEGAVEAGETVWVSFAPRHPCWNEDAVADVTLSWDASRFAFDEALADGRAEATSPDVAGWARVQLADRDGFGGGFRLPFRALASTTADGFVVENVLYSCGERRADQVYGLRSGMEGRLRA